MHSTKPSHQAHNNFNLPNHPIQYIGITSLALLSLITLALVFPFVSNNSSALSPAELQTNMPTSGSIALALPGEATLDVVPTSSGSFSSATAKLSVSSTNPTGYSLYINTNDNTNALANVDSTKTATIPAVSGAQLGSQLDANTWGYNLSPTSSDALSLNYQAVPLKSSTPVLSTKASSSDSYYLTFGTKLDTSLPAGQYANTITISAITNPLYITGLLNLTYMQDMTSSVCANTVAYDGTNIKGQPGSEVTKQLIDSRDGKEYWVAKLADGNCWMTQNLALDLNSSKALTSSDTDLNSKSSWTPTNSTIVSDTLTIPTDATNANSTYSWDLGEWVIKNPLSATSCPDINTGDAMDVCVDLIRVNEADWQNALLETGVSIKDNVYDAHYLVGNYYQWSVATAQSNVSESTVNGQTLLNADDSICPKGWQLPSANVSADKVPFNLSNSFYRLAITYQFDKYPEKIVLSPTYFVRGGVVESFKKQLWRTNAYGFYWSSSTRHRDTAGADRLFLNESEVYSANEGYRAYGQAIRCLAR